MSLTREPQKVVLILGVIILFLIMANIAGLISMYYFGQSRIDIFNFNQELNFPSLYSSATLLLCALLLAFIARTKKRQEQSDYLYWAVLSFIFVFLFADEMASIHEQLIKPVRNALHTTGLLYFAWVIPYGLLLVAIILFYFRFVFSLPVRIRFLIIVSGILYIAGAVGLESVGGYLYELRGEHLAYELVSMGEEIFEMIGILFFIYALLSYIQPDLKDTNKEPVLPVR